MSRRVAYSVEVSPDVQGVTLEEFAGKIAAVLGDPRGWKKYGYDFTRALTPAEGALRIHLETAADADRMCGARGFSCWRPPSNDIVIHAGNWVGGSRSLLPLERYRNYVINHEVGHSLGLEHQACPAAECARRKMAACPASVMQQMTRGPRHVAPCTEADWPLDPDWTIDAPAGARRPFMRLAAGGVPAAPAVLLALVLICVALLAWVSKCHRGGAHRGGAHRDGAVPGPVRGGRAEFDEPSP